MDIDTDRILAVLPHYAAMLILALGAVQLVTIALGELGFWAEFAVILVVVFAYRPVITMLGFEPEPWSDQRR